MNEADTLLNIVRGLALLAILSWACGSRTFLGQPLALRMSPFWLGCRCFGLGIFITLVSLKVTSQQSTLILWIISATCLVLGCARTKVREHRSELGMTPVSVNPKTVPSSVSESSEA